MKVLTLLLVLCMAGVANAGLQFMVNDAAVASGANVDVAPGLVNFSLVNERQETGVFDGGFVALFGAASFGPASIVPGQMPGQWSILDLGVMDLGDGPAPMLFLSWDVPAVDPFKAGKLAEFGINFAGPEAKVQFYDFNAAPVFACQLIPEPMTLSLLGLGVLALRRRR